MTKQELIDRLQIVDNIAKMSKVGRLINNPAKYLSAIFFRKFVYPKNKNERIENVGVFFGGRMNVALPSSTDIFLTGGKSHDSEIRLARFIINELECGDHYLDIGAHYGYFSLLASELVGKEGKVISFEPTTKSFSILKSNTESKPNVVAQNMAVSFEKGVLVFYEFPNMYSEYNSMNVSQFEGESWFVENKPNRVEVGCTTIDEVTQQHSISPKIVKIDVEGAEFLVLSGGKSFLEQHRPSIVMEYLEPNRHNEEHHKAHDLLVSLGYSSFIIGSKGELSPVSDVDAYLVGNQMDSDNIVYRKR